MKATVPTLSAAVFGDPLASPPVSDFASVSTRPSPTIPTAPKSPEEKDRCQETRRDSDFSGKTSRPNPKAIKTERPAKVTRPPRFSSANGITSVALPIHGNPMQWETAQRMNGLSLAHPMHRQRARQHQEQVINPPSRIETIRWTPLLVSESFQWFPQPIRETVGEGSHPTDHGTGASQLAPSTWTPWVRETSAAVVMDLFQALLRSQIPKLWFTRELRRVWRIWERHQRQQISVTFDRKASILGRTKQRRPSNLAREPSRVKVRGIRNFGQTCFLNSVLQALASLDSFLTYLERIVQLHHERLDYGSSDCTTAHNNDNISERLYDILYYVNGGGTNDRRCDPREILCRVSKKHKQFRSRFGRGYGSVGKEQQDAQEFLQALLGMVIAEAQLDSDCSLESSFVSSVGNDSMEQVEETEASQDPDGSPDEYISLSGLLLKMDAEQRVASSQEISAADVAGTDDLNRIHVAEMVVYPESEGDSASGMLREEKKQEDFEGAQNDRCISLQQSVAKKGNSSAKGQKSSAHLMLQTLSPATPSPMSGWLGSTIQCCDCKHVRPIQNAPFVDIPVIPTAVTSFRSSSSRVARQAPSCTLAECLREFTGVEQVRDVECQRCTIDQEIAKLEEETMMLRGAIATVLKRSKKRGAEEDANHVEGLQSELKDAEARLCTLQSKNPDDRDAVESETSDSLCDIDLGQSQPPKRLHRSDATKCLFLTRLPSILCIHVQRRYYDPVCDRISKTLQHVEFPDVLDLSQFCAYGGARECGFWAGSQCPGISDTPNPIWYKLRSVIQHIGNAHAGHYCVFRRVQHGGSEKWFLISDETVTPVTWREVRKCQAYLLFYEAI